MLLFANQVKKEGILMTVQKKDIPTKKGATRKFTYGWVPDLPDQRDFLYSAVLKVPPVLPHSVDLRSKCSDVKTRAILAVARRTLLPELWNFWRERTRTLLSISAGFLFATTRGQLSTA
jgi:hypothetical protein